ncbi:MAG: DUF5677 domain-containing protein [Parcubacteria group bacterium]
MTEQSNYNVEQLTHVIRSRGQILDVVAQRLRTPEIQATFNKWDHNSWCLGVAGDSLVRIRLLTEQSFNFVETMGVIAVARYIFELSVWLYLFRRDPRYGLVYFDQLIDTQQRYYQDVKTQLIREVALLKLLGEREQESQQKAIENMMGLPPDDVRQQLLLTTLKDISEAIDAEASRRFSIYAKDAQTNGYEFQAHLIETESLPQVEQALANISSERHEFNTTVSQDIKDLIPPRWQWRQIAKKVDLTDEYDYIYTFASKLLHATPASITTNHKNLEIAEMEVFLKYIDIKIADVVVLAKEYCKDRII